MLRPPAVILLSGGLDSATVLALALQQGFACHALTFRYGQRHTPEIAAAQNIVQQLALGDHRNADHRNADHRTADPMIVDHMVADIDLRMFGGSALTAEIAVPKDRSAPEMQLGIPVTYVPARNTIFLSFALAWAEVLEASDIFIGVNAIDYSGYPDCRPEYIAAYETMANLATKAAVEGRQRIKLHTPLLRMSKAEIIRTGLGLGVDYALTLSCYDPSPNGEACRRCDACHLRLKGFAEVGQPDPAKYSAS